MTGGHSQAVCFVDLWWTDLDRAYELDEGAGVLSHDEWERADRFASAVHRARFIRCRTLLRRILAGALGENPRDLRLHYGPNGKPFVNRGGGNLHFNVAHSEQSAAIALARGFAIGVDVERFRTVEHCAGVAAVVCSADERREVADAPEPSRQFLTIWTRKEAFVKAVGTGCAEPLSAIRVSAREAAGCYESSAVREVAGWRWLDISSETKAAAVAAHAGAIVVREHDDPAKFTG